MRKGGANNYYQRRRKNKHQKRRKNKHHTYTPSLYVKTAIISNMSDQQPSAQHNILPIKPLSPKIQIPERQTPGSIGYDLHSSEKKVIQPWTRDLIPTGLSVAIPEGCYGRIAPRSSLAWKYSVDVCAGVIDPDYRGEVKVLLMNNSSEEFVVEVGARIAQLIIEKACILDVVVVDELDETQRKGGFGSTGVFS